MAILSLDQLSVMDVPPADYVDIAADAGFDAISPIVGGGDGIHRHAIGDPQTEAMKRRLAERGIALNNMDGLLVLPDMDWGEVRRMVDVSRHLDARRGVTLLFDPEPARAAESLARFCEIADDAGLPMLLEFTAISAVPSLAKAIAYIAGRAGRLRLVIDLLHLSYAGEGPVDVARADAASIGSAQICDAWAPMTLAAYEHRCMVERAAPGDGNLPVVEFLAALPADTPIGVEAPLKRLADSGVSPLQRAKLLHDRARAALRVAATHAAAERARSDASQIRAG